MTRIKERIEYKDERIMRIVFKHLNKKASVLLFEKKTTPYDLSVKNIHAAYRGKIEQKIREGYSLLYNDGQKDYVIICGE